ncbi:hypothetical protein [Pyruvatibacter mobilis]|uniref:hypothetical protein n=1 Tax=Pyruvatibacter mobilis TaxID=1712261 RepID=UPI003BA90350
MAISTFFAVALEGEGIDIDFVAVQPPGDKTNGDGGWGNVLLWIKKNPLRTREKRYFGSGLFGGGLSEEQFDALLFHLDADVLGEESFVNYVKSELGYSVLQPSPDQPSEKAAEIRRVLGVACEFDSMTTTDQNKHVPAPAVETTETWCIASVEKKAGLYEELTGVELTNKFMQVLEKSEGRGGAGEYSKINKSVRRRKRFCDNQMSSAYRIASHCPQFSAICDQLKTLAD